MDKEYLTVKEFAAASGCTTQYIYKILGSHLKPYKKKIDKKIVIKAAAVDLVKNGFSTQPTEETKTTNQTNQPQTADPEHLQPNQPTEETKTTNQTNQNNFEQNEASSGEIEALKMLVKELKQDKEDLKQDKEDLKKQVEQWQQENYKMQQLLADEKNKIKLLEAAAEDPKENVIDLDQDPADLPKTFGAKLKWLFSNK